jgi:hypothetical protein
MLAFFAALLLTAVGVGWYLGWFKLASTPTADGHRSVTIDFNEDKIKADIQKAEQNVQNRINNSPGSPPLPDDYQTKHRDHGHSVAQPVTPTNDGHYPTGVSVDVQDLFKQNQKP